MSQLKSSEVKSKQIKSKQIVYTHDDKDKDKDKNHRWKKIENYRIIKIGRAHV